MSCRSCASGCRCGHGTEAEGRPSLLAIDVVSRILERAVGNVMRRAQAAASGEMTEEEVEEADEKLVLWLTAAFCGRNSVFDTDPDWHPAGLASHLREIFPGTMPEDDEAAVEHAVRVFRSDVLAFYRLWQMGAVHADEARQLHEKWTHRFCGAPTDGFQ